MRVPACFTENLLTILSLKTTENILDSPCHHMVNTRETISRRRPFVEYEFWVSFADFYRLTESVIIMPKCCYVFGNIYQIKVLIFVEFSHFLIVFVKNLVANIIFFRRKKI